MDSETVELLLANRSFLYALLARAFAAEIDESFVEILASDHAREEAALVEAEQTPAIVELVDALRDELTAAGAVQAAGREYVRLFVGPGTLRANPWETVQLSGKRSLFQPGVLQVRESYRAAGFLPARVREVPDDFIGIELDFMAKLAAKALEQFSAGQPDWRQSLVQSRDFLQNHLLKWVGRLADSIVSEYGDVLYARIARLATLVAQRDKAVLERCSA